MSTSSPSRSLPTIMSSIGIGMSSPCSDFEHSGLGAMLDIILPRSPCQHPQDNITHSWFCKQSQCHWDREWTRMYLMNCACRGSLLNIATRPCRTSLSKMLPKRIHPLCVCVPMWVSPGRSWSHLMPRSKSQGGVALHEEMAIYQLLRWKLLHTTVSKRLVPAKTKY